MLWEQLVYRLRWNRGEKLLCVAAALGGLVLAACLSPHFLDLVEPPPPILEQPNGFCQVFEFGEFWIFGSLGLDSLVRRAGNWVRRRVRQRSAPLT
jgi:hypothetical protein